MAGRGWLAVLSGTLVVACHTPPPPRSSLEASAREASASRAEGGTPRPALREEVSVVLGAAERATKITIEGTSEGTLSFRRAGDLVLASDGRAAARIELRVASGSASRGLGFDGRRYGGALIVSAHPTNGLRLENRVRLEQYVEGAVAAEIVLWSADRAEIEAQAVAARTYALSVLERRERRWPRGAFLWDGVEDQAYLGMVELGDGTRARMVRSRLELGLTASRGRVLMRDGRLLEARYHAACGGHTARPGSVFAGVKGWAGARCDPCIAQARAERTGAEAPQLAWTFTASRRELDRLAEAFGVGAPLTRLAPARVDPGGRWLTVELAGSRSVRTVPAQKVRRALGPQRLESLRITSTWPRPGSPIGGGVRFDGLGRGHGVGLCQEGAHGYALRGWTADRILLHYYPGARVERLTRP